MDINKYSNQMGLQVIVHEAASVSPDMDLSVLLPSGNIDLDQLTLELKTWMRRIQHPGLEKLVHTILSGIP